MEDAFVFQAFSCEYIANLLESRARLLPEPGALHLTRRQDLLDLEMPEPDLSAYDEPTGSQLKANADAQEEETSDKDKDTEEKT
jgi:hypothetical protein